uniref:Uncharacterized protein n=1 Tax=Eutreptiella gymnastica TaxID=73025 RepID=A0A6U8C3S1_9EUGL
MVFLRLMGVVADELSPEMSICPPTRVTAARSVLVDSNGMGVLWVTSGRGAAVGIGTCIAGSHTSSSNPSHDCKPSHGIASSCKRCWITTGKTVLTSQKLFHPPCSTLPYETPADRSTPIIVNQ